MSNKIVLKTPEGKNVVVDISIDTRIYESPCNPPNTGTRFTTGTDLYSHVARSGKEYFYFYNWSMWQGTEPEYCLTTREDAYTFLVNTAGEGGYAYPTEDELSTMKEHDFDIFEEDA